LSEVLVLTAPVLGWKMDRLEVEVQNVVWIPMTVPCLSFILHCSFLVKFGLIGFY
jgi:hypothetical protein